MKTPTGGTIMDYRYQYDKAGNIIWRHTEDGPYQYGYDSLDRLTKATPPVSLQQSQTNPNGLPVESYAYDAVHNRTQSQHQPGTWNYNQNNQLLNYGAEDNKTAYTYSPLGHTEQETITRNNNPQTVKNYLYNAAERLVEVKENHSTIAKYQYDPFGRRIGKTVNGQTTYFHYGDEGLVAEYDQNGAVIKTYGWEPQGLWGTSPLWQAEQNVFYFFHNDHLGTSQRLTDKDGKLAWAMQSEAFGKTTPKTNNSTINNLRFPGQYYDEEIGIYHNYFRFYDQNIGRYIHPDPLGIDGGYNLYLYSLANPIIYTDRFGLAPNGCGSEGGQKFPDNPAWYNFKPCCDNHDDCYADCNGPPRSECDNKFCTCVFKSCTKIYPLLITISVLNCASTAGAYCGAVKAFGGGPYEKARKDCDKCTPE